MCTCYLSLMLADWYELLDMTTLPTWNWNIYIKHNKEAVLQTWNHTLIVGAITYRASRLYYMRTPAVLASLWVWESETAMSPGLFQLLCLTVTLVTGITATRQKGSTYIHIYSESYFSHYSDSILLAWVSFWDNFICYQCNVNLWS